MDLPSKVIENEVVEIDYRTFEDTVFRRCTLVYKGGVAPILKNVAFDECSWTFDGPARNTIELIRFLAQSGDEAKQVILDQMLGISE